MKKIKKLSQRLQTGNFSQFYPIGADGVNIDMISESNLEEELHLGSPSITYFDVDTNTGEIRSVVEEYKKDESQTGNYYVMITKFKVEDNEMIITQELSFVKEDGQSVLKKTKIATFSSSDNSGIKIKEVVE